MQVDKPAKTAQLRQHMFHAAGVGRQIGAFGARFKIRRGRDEEGKGDVLRQVGPAIGKPMLLDEGAQLIARVPGVRGALQRLVDLLADLLAHRVRGGKPLIITARIQRNGNVKQRLAILQGDIRARAVQQSRRVNRGCSAGGGLRIGGGLRADVRPTQRNQKSKRDKRQERGEKPVRFSGLLAVKLHRAGGKPLHKSMHSYKAGSNQAAKWVCQD